MQIAYQFSVRNPIISCLWDVIHKSWIRGWWTNKYSRETNILMLVKTLFHIQQKLLVHMWESVLSIRCQEEQYSINLSLKQKHEAIKNGRNQTTKHIFYLDIKTKSNIVLYKSEGRLSWDTKYMSVNIERHIKCTI